MPPRPIHNKEVRNKMKLTETNRQKCEEAADKILGVFRWECSNEGHAYWSEVRSKLKAYAKGPKYCEECGQEVKK